MSLGDAGASCHLSRQHAGLGAPTQPCLQPEAQLLWTAASPASAGLRCPVYRTGRRPPGALPVADGAQDGGHQSGRGPGSDLEAARRWPSTPTPTPSSCTGWMENPGSGEAPAGCCAHSRGYRWLLRKWRPLPGAEPPPHLPPPPGPAGTAYSPGLHVCGLSGGKDRLGPGADNVTSTERARACLRPSPAPFCWDTVHDLRSHGPRS